MRAAALPSAWHGGVTMAVACRCSESLMCDAGTFSSLLEVLHVSLLREFMGAALAMMRRHEDAWPFRDPVSRAEVPDYYDIIRVGCARHTSHTPQPASAVQTQPALQRTWHHARVQRCG